MMPVVKYELMIKKDEGHGYRKEENRYDFYGKMESFLAENLGPGQARRRESLTFSI